MGDEAGGDVEHEAFYAELVRHNAGIIASEEQQVLRAAVIVVAGCGSIGGATVEALIRLGAEHLRLVEPQAVALPDLNRQRACLGDVGENKGAVLARRAHMINPFASVEVRATGVTDRAAGALLDGAEVVIDGIDIARGAPEKACLHRAAALVRVPVVSGRVDRGRQTMLIDDYRRTGAVPATSGRPSGPQGGPCQEVVYTADLFGALACRAVVDLLAGRPMRHRIVVDLHRLSLSWPDRIRARVFPR